MCPQPQKKYSHFIILKGRSYGHNHKRWSYIVNPMNVGPYCESYEGGPMFGFLKVCTTLQFFKGGFRVDN